MLYNGHPAPREEYLPRIRELYEEQQFNAPAAVQENAPDYEVGDHVVVDLPTQTIEGTVGYVGETDIRIDPENGYSWEHEVINKQQFDDGLRQDEPETEAPAQDESEQLEENAVYFRLRSLYAVLPRVAAVFDLVGGGVWMLCVDFYGHFDCRCSRAF